MRMNWCEWCKDFALRFSQCFLLCNKALGKRSTAKMFHNAVQNNKLFQMSVRCDSRNHNPVGKGTCKKFRLNVLFLFFVLQVVSGIWSFSCYILLSVLSFCRSLSCTWYVCAYVIPWAVAGIAMTQTLRYAIPNYKKTERLKQRRIAFLRKIHLQFVHECSRDN